MNKPMTNKPPTAQEIQVPPGYLMRANGDLVRQDNVTPLEAEEDKLVKMLFPRAQALHDQIGRFKHDAMTAVEEMVERCVKEHGIKRFEKIKGNLQFTSFDGNYKIQRAIDDKIEYDSSIEVARQKFDMYVDVLKQQSGDDAALFIEEAFSLKNNRWTVSKLVELCNKRIDHPLYKQAVIALRQALFVSGSKAYLRFYIRNEKDDSWMPLPLQFSSVPAIADGEDK